MQYYGQIAQDYFITRVLKGKKNGIFLEIGSHHPKEISNTYKLETEYEWTGLMIDYDAIWEESYKQHRPKSNFIIADATKIDYESELQKRNFPDIIDYLQLDLEVENRSTLTTLELLDTYVFTKRKFAIITFEHDIYRGDYFDTRNISREIFKKHGYYCVYPDIGSPSIIGHAGMPALHFEDWYVHPDLVDMDYIKKIQLDNVHDFKELINVW